MMDWLKKLRPALQKPVNEAAAVVQCQMYAGMPLKPLAGILAKFSVGVVIEDHFLAQQG